MSKDFNQTDNMGSSSFNFKSTGTLTEIFHDLSVLVNNCLSLLLHANEWLTTRQTTVVAQYWLANVKATAVLKADL